MNIRHLLAAPLFVLSISTAMAQDQPQATARPAAAGFLSDYTRLTPSLSPKNDFQSYTAAGAKDQQLGRVYIAPIVSFPADVAFEYIDRATLSALESKFYTDVSAALNPNLILVNTPEQADTVVQMAITAVSADEPGRKPRDFLPFRLISKPIKDATMGKEQEVLVTMEMKIRTVKSNQIIFESLNRAKGKTMGRTEDPDLHANIKELEPAIESWTKQVVKSVTALQSGK